MPDGDTSPIQVQPALVAALAITGVATLVLGVLPGIAMHFGDIAGLTGALGK